MTKPIATYAQPMASIRLSDIGVRNLKPIERRQLDIYDSTIPGFGVRVSPKGTKSFFVYYRVGRCAKRLTLGRFPVLRLAEAREQARRALLSVNAGKDPAVEKQQARESYEGRLFDAVVEVYIETYARVNTRRWAETARILRREFCLPWKGRLIGDITTSDVRLVLDGIVSRGASATANHALASLRKFFNWATERGHVDQSPCSRLGAPTKLKSRERVRAKMGS